jgi:hypothetical protein
VEASRKRKKSSRAVPAPPLRAEEAPEGLDWGASSNRYFPGRSRHDLEGPTKYAAYKQGREWRTTPARLSLVPTEGVSAVTRREAGAQRLLDAIAADQMERRSDPLARERSELEQRRGELRRSLPALSEQRADSYRRYGDALALERAGVKYERPEEMVRLDEAEVTADAAIRAVQHELRDIDTELKLMPRPGRAARLGRAARRARANP